MKTNQNTVGFDDIFDHAKSFGVEWNPANDLFFSDSILNYKGYNDFDIAELNGELEDFKTFEECGVLKEGDYPLTPQWNKAKWIIRDFMQKKRVKQLLVLND